MKKVLFFIACVVLLIGIFSSANALEETVIVLSYAGDVKITPAGAIVTRACEPEMVLKEGDRIKTGEESYVEIAFERKRENIARIEENSDVIIKLDKADKIELINGELFILLRDLRRGETFRVKTPSGVCGARGTGWKTSADKKSTSVAAFDGKVFMRGINKDGSVMEKDFWVSEGYQRTVKKFKKPGDSGLVPEDELEKMREKFGLGKKKKMHKKKKKIEKLSNMDEKRMEGLMEKKDDKRLDSIRDKRDDKSSSGRGIISP